MFSYIVTFLLGFVLCKYLPDLKSRIFARYMDYFTKTVGAKYIEFKKETFAPISDIKSQLAVYQSSNTIKILEIGVGTGANFQFFPEGCHLVVVDPNPHFKQYYDANRALFPKIKTEEIIVAKGENMDMVEDNSVDVVVMSLVLCSVDSTREVLQQVLRVLAPGGKMFFVEHIREWEDEAHAHKQKIQDFLTWTRIWPQIFDGCELNRDTLKEIQAAGFSEVHFEKKHAPIDHFLFQIVNPHVVGYATK